MFRVSLRFITGMLCASFLVVPAVSNATELKEETLRAWDAYIQTANSQMRGRLQGSFLWVDEAPDRVGSVRGGKILVSSVGEKNPKPVPSGLIHGPLMISGLCLPPKTTQSFGGASLEWLESRVDLDQYFMIAL